MNPTATAALLVLLAGVPVNAYTAQGGVELCGSIDVEEPAGLPDYSSAAVDDFDQPRPGSAIDPSVEPSDHQSTVGSDETLAPWAGKFHWTVGLTFTSGIFDLKDAVSRDLRSRSVNVDWKFVWPVGISFQPYWQFHNGLGIGAGLGPVNLLVIEGFPSFSQTSYNVIVPVGGDLRYTFFKRSSVAPYARGGARYPFVSGKLLGKGRAGPFVAGGIVFLDPQRGTRFGFEVAYDSSEVSLGLTPAGQRTKPDQIAVSFFVH